MLIALIVLHESRLQLAKEDCSTTTSCSKTASEMQRQDWMLKEKHQND
jgi:hypothetical protein